jgi:hypothetical protein
LKSQVEDINNSTVNRLEKMIKNTTIKFKATGLEKFNYQMLMQNKNVELDNTIIEKYVELDVHNGFVSMPTEDLSSGDKLYVYYDIRNQILEINPNINYVVDVLIQHLYGNNKSKFKTTLWSSFGDIILQNLSQNVLMKNKYCVICDGLMTSSNNRHKYCKECWKEIENINHKNRNKKWYKNKISDGLETTPQNTNNINTFTDSNKSQ